MTGLADRVAALLGRAVLSSRRLHGGDLSAVFLMRLADDAEIVAKSGPRLRAEAAMLAAIRAAGAPAPRVLAAADDLLLMEALPGDGRPAWADLGRAVRALHAATSPGYGWTEDHGFGPVPIPNAPAADWPAFWAERRLLAWPEALPADLSRRLDRLAVRLPDLLPRHPRPSLLHGDLWAGNILFSEGRVSGLIDPACCWGHAEADVAMLHLFAAPGPDFTETYGAPEPGWAERRRVYQLWPALVHLRLFGVGYRGMVETLLGDLP